MLRLSEAQGIIDTLLKKAALEGSRPLAVAITDIGATPIMLKRQDGCGMGRVQLCLAKAQGCLALNIPTRNLGRLHTEQPGMHALLANTLGHALLPLAGGVLVKNKRGDVVGALGVSGGNLEDEEAWAIDAIQTCGFNSDPQDARRDD